jgi:hypothetical protein
VFQKVAVVSPYNSISYGDDLLSLPELEGIGLREIWDFIDDRVGLITFQATLLSANCPSGRSEPSPFVVPFLPYVIPSLPVCHSERSKESASSPADTTADSLLASRFGMTILREVRGSRTGQNLLAYAGPSASLALPRTRLPQNHGCAGVRRVYRRGGHHDHVLPHALPHPAGQDIIRSQPVESSVFLASILVSTIGNFCLGVPVSDDVARGACGMMRLGSTGWGLR